MCTAPQEEAERTDPIWTSFLCSQKPLRLLAAETCREAELPGRSEEEKANICNICSSTLLTFDLKKKKERRQEVRDRLMLLDKVEEKKKLEETTNIYQLNQLKRLSRATRP